MPKEIGVVDLIDNTYRLQLPRLREICQLLGRELREGVTVESFRRHDASWVRVSVLAPLIRNGIDWMISTTVLILP